MRLSINVSEETNRRLTERAKKIGTSKGAMITIWVNEKLNSLDKAESMFSDLLENPMFQEMASKVLAEEMKKEVKDEK